MDGAGRRLERDERSLEEPGLLLRARAALLEVVEAPRDRPLGGLLLPGGRGDFLAHHEGGSFQAVPSGPRLCQRRGDVALVAVADRERDRDAATDVMEDVGDGAELALFGKAVQP